MSGYADKLSLRKETRYPRNPCKFIRLLMRDGDWDKYADIMEAMNMDYEMTDIAAILEEDLGFVVNKNDIWKHRHMQCGGCRTMSETSNNG